jgi:hypothetical protein
MEDRTQGNAAAERYVALRDELRVFEDRLNKALAHREAFSEKVLARVTSDYQTKLEQLSRELQALEHQLREELAAFEKQLQSAMPVRQQLHEDLEELELRHLTGEISTREYTARKAALEQQRPISAAQMEVLQRNVEFYSELLAGAAETGMEAPGEGFVDSVAASLGAVRTWTDDEAQPPQEAEELEPEEALERDGYAPGDPSVHADWGDGHSLDDSGAVRVQNAELETQTYLTEEEEGPDERSLPAASAEEAEDSYFDGAPIVEEFEEEALVQDLTSDDVQDEEAFFENELADAEEPAAAEWYAGTEAGSSNDDELRPVEAEALDQDFDQIPEHDALAAEEVEIPEELLLDEGAEYLDAELPEEDSAALLQSTDRLLQDEALEDVFDEELEESSDAGHQLEPAIVLREGMPDEKIFYMTNNVLSIGRGPDNDIQLSTDTSVSRHHSRITYEDDEYWIADLGSSNGTIVNGARVTKTILSGDDEISIGQTVLRFKFC